MLLFQASATESESLFACTSHSLMVPALLSHLKGFPQHGVLVQNIVLFDLIRIVAQVLSNVTVFLKAVLFLTWAYTSCYHFSSSTVEILSVCWLLPNFCSWPWSPLPRTKLVHLAPFWTLSFRCPVDTLNRCVRTSPLSASPFLQQRSYNLSLLGYKSLIRESESFLCLPLSLASFPCPLELILLLKCPFLPPFNFFLLFAFAQCY